MCGIVGYAGSRDCREILLDGLRRLEYRGYDSAGVTLLSDDGARRHRTVGPLAALSAEVAAGAGVATLVAPAHAGIGHTRWATHGRVTEENAHPHADGDENVHVVLNGIIENHVALRAELESRGVAFSSQTDAEVVAHLLAEHDETSLEAAVARVRRRLRGQYAFVVLRADEPGRLVATRHECPLVVGVGEGERFVGSSDHAFCAYTATTQELGEDEIVALTDSDARFMGADLEPVRHDETMVSDPGDAADRGAFATWMLKEIHEQGDAIARTVAEHLGADGRLRGCIDRLGVVPSTLRRVTIVGCGTSYHAALAGRYAIEEWARVPVDVEIASEFRYRIGSAGPGELVVGITQSGETADTLAALRSARAAGAAVMAITNVASSQAAREADAVLLTKAGPEIGVAATKTFTAQVAAMLLLGLELARARGALSIARVYGLTEQLRRLPDAIDRLLVSAGPQVRALAESWHDAPFFLFLGRHIGLPIALEGALKLKEVTYIATDAYAAGEMKHGPIAMLDERTPVVCVATDSPILDKTLSNVAEVRARGAYVIAIATEGSDHVAAHVDAVVWVPSTDFIVQSCLAAIPLQLLAHEIAVLRGLDVDRPRNLAKTVTVE